MLQLRITTVKLLTCQSENQTLNLDSLSWLAGICLWDTLSLGNKFYLDFLLTIDDISEERNNGRFKNVYAVGDYNHAKKNSQFYFKH